MSIAWMTKVWNYSKHSGTPLLLMLAIADCANEQGEAFPGRTFLASRIRKSKSYTTELLERLIKSHELRRTHSGGKGQGDAHHYKITLKGRPADPSMLEEIQGSASRPKKGRFRVGLGSVVTLKNRTEPIEPLTNKNIDTSTTTTNPVGVVMDDWDLSRLLKLGQITKARMEEIAALEPAPSASVYVAHYLYSMTIRDINSPAHFAAKRIAEQMTARDPFTSVAALGPRALTECLHWIFTGCIDDFNDLSISEHLSRREVNLLSNYLHDCAAQMIPRAFDELGLAAYLPKPEEPKPVAEFEPRERPVLDEWQQALELLRVHYPPATIDNLKMCTLVGHENGTILIAVPSPHLLQWFEVQKMPTSLHEYGISVAFKLQ